MMTPLALQVWYRIAADNGQEPIPISRAELLAAVTELGIEGCQLAAGNATDAFRTATSRMVGEYTKDGRLIRLAVREGRKNDDMLLRYVYRIWKDDDGIKHEARSATLEFFRPRRTAAGRIHGSERLRTMVDRRLDGVDKEHVTALVQRAVARYEATQSNITPHGLRSLVRNQVARLGGIALIGAAGSQFLVPTTEHEYVKRLQALVERCGGECSFNWAEVPDTPRWRATYAASADADLEATAGHLLQEVRDFLATKDFTPSGRQLAAWRLEANVITERVMTIGDLVEEPCPRTSTVLETVLELLAEMPATRGNRRLSAR